MKQNLWFAVATLAVFGVAWAVDPPAPATPPPAEDAFPVFDDVVPAAPPPGPAAKAGDQAEEEEDEETLPPLPEGAVQTGPTAQRFDPTEEVRADFPVSFPVDI